MTFPRILFLSSFLLLLLLIVVNANVSKPESEPRRLIERTEPLPLPSNWIKLPEISDSSRTIKAIFLLKQRNLSLLKNTFTEVSDPSHPKYGQYLTLQQLADQFAPLPETIDQITSFLQNEYNLKPTLTLSRDILQVEMSSSVAESVFGIEFGYYRHKSGVTVQASLGPYSLPERLASLVDVVTGVVGLPDLDRRPRVVFGPKTAALGTEINPTVIRKRYNISSNLIVTHPKNSHAVAEFENQFYSPTDLSLFWQNEVPFASFRPVDSVVGVNQPGEPGEEASLDIQYIMGVAPNATTWFYSIKSVSFWDDVSSWVTLLNDETNCPLVHSISYGTQVKSTYPTVAYQERLDAEFQKLGVRGISIIFASGDSGAGCAESLGCKCKLTPAYPASSQYVTAVGATRFLEGNSGAEGAVKAFGSGGGFDSDVFPTSTWQQTAVSNYLDSSVSFPPTCSFNSSGRATPDVSALGDVYFQVYVGGSLTNIGGTSASAPTFAAVITLLNDIRLHAGKPTLGFLNPWIYQSATTPGAFFDVTVGSNTKLGICCLFSQNGFDCAQGYDTITGVGTPNFEVLKTLV